MYLGAGEAEFHVVFCPRVHTGVYCPDNLTFIGVPYVYSRNTTGTRTDEQGTSLCSPRPTDCRATTLNGGVVNTFDLKQCLWKSSGCTVQLPRLFTDFNCIGMTPAYVIIDEAACISGRLT